MKNINTFRHLLLAALILSAASIYAQPRTIGAFALKLDDNAGNTILVKTHTSGWTGDLNFVLPVPPSGSIRSGFVYHGTNANQTTRFDGNFWVPTSVLLNDGSNLTVAGDVYPDATGTRDLGSPALHYANVYADNLIGAISPSSITLPLGNIIVGNVLGQGSAVPPGAASTVPISNGTTIAYGFLSGSSLNLTQGSIFVGDATNKASELGIGAANTIPISNGTTLAYGQITNANVSNAAAIDGTKINPNFGAQNITTTGKATTASTVGGDGGTTLTTKDYVDGAFADAVILAPNSATRNLVQATGDFPELILRQSVGQTVNPLIVQNSAGTPLAWVTPIGEGRFTGLSGAGAGMYAGNIPMPVLTSSLVIPFTGVQANSAIIVTFMDPTGVDNFTVSVVGNNPGVDFTVAISGVVSSASASVSYIVVNP